MTGHPNKYLEWLKSENSKRGQGTTLQNPQNSRQEPSKTSKIIFEGFEGSQFGAFSPKLDPQGVPCGLCPTCRRGEFWRYPKFHNNHDPRGWMCWFCSPPPEGSGPCDFCGVPEHSK